MSFIAEPTIIVEVSLICFMLSGAVSKALCCTRLPIMSAGEDNCGRGLPIWSGVRVR